MALDLERAGVRFTEGTAEGVDGIADSNVDESGGLEKSVPACTRQATGDSTRPEIDVALGLFGHGHAVGDVGELQVAAGS